MEIGINLRHQNGADFNELLTAVCEAERLGFGSVVFPDHYVAIEHVIHPDGLRGQADITSPTGPSDAWTVIASLVMHTSTLRFGTMMTSSTFRHPGPLAVIVAELNRFSGGRVDLGIGTNWHEGEHLRFGIPYPPLNERYKRLDEQLSIIRGLWLTPAGETFDIDGDFYRLAGGEGIPRPANVPAPRVVIGGSGLRRTPRLAAKHADEVNSLARQPEGAAPFFDACRAARQAIGRDPDTLRCSVLLPITCGVDDADTDRQLTAAGLRRDQIDPALICTPQQLVERLERWREAGVDRVVLSRRGAVDLPSLRMLGEAVVAALQ